MPKTCYFGLKSSNRIYKYALIMPFLAYIFVKTNISKKGRGCCAFCSEIRGKYRWIYVQGCDIRQQTAVLKHDRSWSHISVAHHQICLPHRLLYVWFKLPSHFLLYTVQITHNLNGIRMWHECTKANNTSGIKPCVYSKINAKHTHSLIHMKYLPRNDPTYNQ